MENVKISIIVSVFNTEKYLRECLNSLVNQTFKSVEIICVDDGSTDNSPEILEEFKAKDKRIKVIHQENFGPSVARNNALKIAQGDYIGFVDSDDWVDLDFFEKLYNAAKKNNADIAAGDFYRRGKKIKSQKLKYKKEEVFINPTDKIKSAYVPKYNYIWNKIYRRDSLLKLNLQFEKGRYYEDMLWLVKIIYFLNGFVTVPNTFYHYRKTNNSIVTKKSLKHMKDRVYAENEMVKFMYDHNVQILIPCKKAEKLKVSLFGINVLKVEYYFPNITKYKLFGFLTVLTVKKVF